MGKGLRSFCTAFYLCDGAMGWGACLMLGSIPLGFDWGCVAGGGVR